VKRLFDIFAGALLLLACSPLLLALAFVIRRSMGAPVLFRQVRPGLRGEPFTILKFRTMRDAEGKDDRPLPDAERLTRLGAFLRASSLDELPELWNVLKGEMSMVGPRPLLMQYLDRYTPRQAKRHEVRPGITGWAQIQGRNAISWEEKFELDVWYVEHRSFRLDMVILWRTLKTVLKREGISAPGEATAKEFMGSEREGDH